MSNLAWGFFPSNLTLFLFNLNYVINRWLVFGVFIYLLVLEKELFGILAIEQILLTVS